MKNIANFLFEAGMLKRTPRTGFQFLGSGAESVAEHIFRTSLIGYTLAQLDEEADAGRVVLLCLFHDIPEARTGDLNYVNKKYVKVDERKAVEDLARTLPFGDDYRSLHEEFAAKLTREACLAHDADQLEMSWAPKDYRTSAIATPMNGTRPPSSGCRPITHGSWRKRSGKPIRRAGGSMRILTGG